jgi:hypothetical protein
MGSTYVVRTGRVGAIKSVSDDNGVRFVVTDNDPAHAQVFQVLSDALAYWRQLEDGRPATPE